MTKNVTNIAIKLFNSLDENNIRHCHWKSNQHLEEALTGVTDIDMLVCDKQAHECEEVLGRLNYKRVNSKSWTSYPGIEDWIGFDEVTGELVHIHLHYRLLTGKKHVKEQRLPWENCVLQHTIKESNFNVSIIEPNLEIVLLYIRTTLKISNINMIKGFLKLDFIPEYVMNEIRFLKKEIEPEILRTHINKLIEQPYGDKLVSIIMNDDINSIKTILKIKKIVLKTIRNRKRHSGLFMQTKFMINYIYVFFLRVIRKLFRNKKPLMKKSLHNGGRMIAVIGCDGAGKSTITNEIEKWLSWKIDTHKIYLGSGDGPVGFTVKLMNIFANLYYRKRKQSNNEFDVVKEEQKKSNNSKIRNIVASIYLTKLAKQRYKRILQGNQYNSNGAVVLTDRFPQSQFEKIYDGPGIDLSRANTKISNNNRSKEREIYRKIEDNQPEIMIKLIIPADIAYQRKPDHDFNMIKRKVNITEKLKFNGSNVYRVDASQPLTKVLLEVKKIVWNNL